MNYSLKLIFLDNELFIEVLYLAKDLFINVVYLANELFIITDLFICYMYIVLYCHFFTCVISFNLMHDTYFIFSYVQEM
jgi:hypothetical protein